MAGSSKFRKLLLTEKFIFKSRIQQSAMSKLQQVKVCGPLLYVLLLPKKNDFSCRFNLPTTAASKAKKASEIHQNLP